MNKGLPGNEISISFLDAPCVLCIQLKSNTKVGDVKSLFAGLYKDVFR